MNRRISQLGQTAQRSMTAVSVNVSITPDGNVVYKGDIVGPEAYAWKRLPS